MCRWGCRENNMVCMNVLRYSLKLHVLSTQHLDCLDNMARGQAIHYNEEFFLASSEKRFCLYIYRLLTLMVKCICVIGTECKQPV